MPKQRDNRTKEEISERLKKDDRLNVQDVRAIKKKRRFLPIGVATAALLIIALLTPSLIGSLDTNKQTADYSNVERSSKDVSRVTKDDSSMNESSSNGIAKSSLSMQDTTQYAYFLNETDGGIVWNVGLQDAQAISIPVSIWFSAKQLKEKGLSTSATDLELYNAFATELDEEMMGFEMMHPFDATFTEKDKILNVFLNDKHSYDTSTAAQEVFMDALKQTFPNYSEIRLADANGEPVEFDQVGAVEPIHAIGQHAHTPYYLYTQEDGREYLSPNAMQQADSFEEALLLMQSAPNELFAPIIPESLKFTVATSEKVVEVTFKEQVMLDEMGIQEASQFIDGLALTARSFGVKLKLTNIDPSNWNGIDFNEPLPEAVGANPIVLPF